MKTLLSRIAVLIIFLALGIAGCNGQETEPAPAPTSPPPTPEPTFTTASDIVQGMIDRLNAGDVEGSLAYFADDAMTYIVGLPPTGMEVYAGKKQIRALYEDSVANHFQWETTITSVDGDIVWVKAKTWLYGTKTISEASSRRIWLPIVVVGDASQDVVSSDKSISIVS